MGHLFETNTEFVIRTVMGGVAEGDRACYVCFDLGIQVDKDSAAREIRVGIHLLRWRGRIIGCADDDFFGSFDRTKQWESISTHDSCWADSTMGFMRDVVSDITTKKGESKYAERYKDDKFKWNNVDGVYDNITMHMETCKVLTIEDIKDVEYVDRHSDHEYKRRLVPEFMLKG